jgi:hypothetical protein
VEKTVTASPDKAQFLTAIEVGAEDWALPDAPLAMPEQELAPRPFLFARLFRPARATVRA